MTNQQIIKRLEKHGWKAIRGIKGFWCIINEYNLHVVTSTNLSEAYKFVKVRLK